jgi:hypothetical protein
MVYLEVLMYRLLAIVTRNNYAFYKDGFIFNIFRYSSKRYQGNVFFTCRQVLSECLADKAAQMTLLNLVPQFLGNRYKQTEDYLPILRQ